MKRQRHEQSAGEIDTSPSKAQKKTHGGDNASNWSILKRRLLSSSTKQSFSFLKPGNLECPISLEPLTSISFVFLHVSNTGACHGYDGMQLALHLEKGGNFESPITRSPFTPLDIVRLDRGVGSHCESLKLSFPPNMFVRRYHPAWRRYNQALAIYNTSTCNLQYQFDETMKDFDDIGDKSTSQVLMTLRRIHSFIRRGIEICGDLASEWIATIRTSVIAPLLISNDDDDDDVRDSMRRRRATCGVMIESWLASLECEWIHYNSPCPGGKPDKPLINFNCNAEISMETRQRWLAEEAADLNPPSQQQCDDEDDDDGGGGGVGVGHEEIPPISMESFHLLRQLIINSLNDSSSVTSSNITQ